MTIRTTFLQVVGYDGQERVAVTYVTPPERLIARGLPPTSRYLGLLQAGSQEAQLHPKHVSWLTGLSGIDNKERGDEYRRSAIDGSHLKNWPKTQELDQQRQQRRRKGKKRHMSQSPQAAR